jgi:putative FmdB family regulatory protein
MPLYEYECQQCHRRVEKRQKFSDPEITECPHCGGHLERVLSAPAISFKGGGWYKDLYSSAKPSTGGGESKPSGDNAPAAGPSGGEGSGAAAASAVAPSTPAPAPAASAPAKKD